MTDKSKGPAPGKGPTKATSSASIPVAGRRSGATAHIQFNAKEWRDVCVCANHDQESPATWIKQAVLSWLPETLDEIGRQAIPENQRKAEDEDLMLKIRYVMGCPAKPMFSPEEKQAIALWAGLNRFDDFVRKSALFEVSEGLAQMESFIKSKKGDRKCKARARRKHSELAPLMAALGWYDTLLPVSIPAPGGMKHSTRK